jgi:N6-L-threonylcarbamoyladenine synthase
LRQRGNLDFSFSGLKTAVRLQIEALGDDASRQAQADLALALQDAVVDSLLEKTERALEAVDSEIRGLYLAGGVAANGPLRERFADLAARRGLLFRPPAFVYCTDNAAMIAWAGRCRLLAGGRDPLSHPAFARAALHDWP